MGLNAENMVLKAPRIEADHMTAFSCYNEVMLTNWVPLDTLDILVDARSKVS